MVYRSASDNWKIEAQSGGSGITSTSNVGSGAGLAKALVGSDAPFKSIIGETDKVTITDNTNDVTITLGSKVVITDLNNVFTVEQKLNDSVLLTFGTGDDASLYSDGASFFVDYNKAGVSGAFTVQNNGTDVFQINASSTVSFTTPNAFTIQKETGHTLLYLVNSETGATNNRLADFNFRGKNSVGTVETFGGFIGRTGNDIVSASRNGRFDIFVLSAGANLTQLIFDGNTGLIEAQVGLDMNANEIDNISNIDINTGGSIDVDGTQLMVLSSSEVVFQTGVGLSMAAGQRIRWNEVQERSIVNDTSGFQFRVQTADTFEFYEQGVLIAQIDSTELRYNVGGANSDLVLGGANTLADNEHIASIKFNANDGEVSPVEQTYFEFLIKMQDDAIGAEDATAELWMMDDGALERIAVFNGSQSSFYFNDAERMRVTNNGIGLAGTGEISLDNLDIGSGTVKLGADSGGLTVTVANAMTQDFIVDATTSLVIAETEIAVPAGNKITLDGVGGNDYIHQPSVNTIEIVALSVEGVQVKGDGTVNIGDGTTTASRSGRFLGIPTTSGAPTGTPANIRAGCVALCFDTTNNELYIYDGGWVSVALT